MLVIAIDDVHHESASRPAPISKNLDRSELSVVASDNDCGT
jgi:hypothetical protein